MLLSEDHLAVQDAVRAYVQDCIAPHAARWDKEHHFPAAELRGLAELGCYGVAVHTGQLLTLTTVEVPPSPAAISSRITASAR